MPKGVWLAVLIALGLGACRDYEQLAYRAHQRYERSHLPSEAARPFGVERRMRARGLSARLGARARPARMQRRTAEEGGRFRLHPNTPYVGSAEWKQEQAQEARREREIARKIKGICGRC